jgi:peptide-methionine (R)-S-oxide reductase
MKMNRLLLSSILMLSLALNACLQSSSKQPQARQDGPEKFFVDIKGDTIHTIIKTSQEWKSELDPQTYYVMREEGTERPFTSELNENHDTGIFVCRACGLPLFSSSAKFNSGTGWPSFYEPIDKTHVFELSDRSAGMLRTEVQCHRCGGHLGHVFDDGPQPTGLRYCMNGIALAFEKK